MDFAVKVVRDMDPLFILARATSAVFGTASVFMTYLIGKALRNERVGLIAALFLCLNIVNIELSHYARVDATLCLVVLVAFYFVTKIYIGGPLAILKYYMLAGLFSGIAFQTKLPAVILVIPFLVAHIFRSQRENKLFINIIFSKSLVFFSAFFILGLIIGNPAVLFAPGKFLASILGMGRVYTIPVNETRGEHIGFISYIIYFYKEFGILLSLLAVFSVVKGFISKQKDDILILSFIIPFYLLMGASWYMISSSYMIPLMPFLYILCAKYLLQIIEKSNFSQKAMKGVLISAILLLIIQPLINVVIFEISLSGKNTRVVAKEWIERNIPFGSKILMDSGKSINSFAPKIAMNRDSINRVLTSKEVALAKGELVDSTKMLNKSSLQYYEMLLKTVPNESYDIYSTMFGLDVNPIESYLDSQYQYFIISKQMKNNRTNTFFNNRYPEIAAFYLSLDTDKRVELIKAIGPTFTNKGDTFYIYKLHA
jgi:hypothetical protein